MPVAAGRVLLQGGRCRAVPLLDGGRLVGLVVDNVVEFLNIRAALREDANT